MTEEDGMPPSEGGMPPSNSDILPSEHGRRKREGAGGVVGWSEETRPLK